MLTLHQARRLFRGPPSLLTRNLIIRSKLLSISRYFPFHFLTTDTVQESMQVRCDIDVEDEAENVDANDAVHQLQLYLKRSCGYAMKDGNIGFLARCQRPTKY